MLATQRHPSWVFSRSSAGNPQTREQKGGRRCVLGPPMTGKGGHPGSGLGGRPSQGSWASQSCRCFARRRSAKCEAGRVAGFPELRAQQARGGRGRLSALRLRRRRAQRGVQSSPRPSRSRRELRKPRLFRKPCLERIEQDLPCYSPAALGFRRAFLIRRGPGRKGPSAGQEVDKGEQEGQISVPYVEQCLGSGISGL